MEQCIVTSSRPRSWAQWAVVLLLSSCQWTSNEQYFIHWGVTRDDVVIREATSWDLTLARELFYNNNSSFQDQMGGFSCLAHHSWTSASRCVMKLLHLQTSMPDLAQGIWGRATAYGLRCAP